MNENSKMIKVGYLVADILSLYNITVGRPALNLSGATLSTLYLSMKYMLPNEQVIIVQCDQETPKNVTNVALV